MAPFVSVIIPVYNGERFLGDAVKSIEAQQYHPVEIIVVDDGSQDKTSEVATSLGSAVIYVYQENQGPPAARNRGLTLAQGDIITFLDVDDVWTETKLALQLNHLRRNPKLDIVVGNTQCMVLQPNEHGASEFVVFGEPWFAWSLGGAAIRRTVFTQGGNFDQTQRYCDDIDWFLRARECGASILIHDEPVQFYRRHENNITREKRLDQRYLATAIHKSLKRRKEAESMVSRPLPDALQTYRLKCR